MTSCGARVFQPGGWTAAATAAVHGLDIIVVEKTGLIGGTLAGSAYAIAIWAMSQGPMAHVVALRETSVIMAALIGALVLKEPFGPRRIAAACVVTLGAVLLQTG